MNEAMQQRPTTLRDIEGNSDMACNSVPPPPMPPMPVTIFPVLNGFVVKAGCQLVVFQTIERTMSEIARYYKDPNKVRKEYEAAAVNGMLMGVPQPAAPCRDSEDIGSLLRNR